MLPILNLGGLALPMRELVIVVSFWLALDLLERLAFRQGLDQGAFANFGLLSIIASLLGARLAYAASYFESFMRQPFGLLSLSTQSMAWTEGAVLGLLVGLLYLYRKQIALPAALDILMPVLALLWAMFGLATFFSGDGYGAVTSLPWGIYLWEEVRHPVQLYQALAGGLITLTLIRALPHAPYAGWNALLGLVLLGMSMIFFEGFLGYPALTSDGLRISQLWGLAITMMALWKMYRAQDRARIV
jgi:prolipoprotein diacylglyceryltransferase